MILRKIFNPISIARYMRMELIASTVLLVFMAILPFSLISDFNKMGVPELMIPLSILVSFVFGVMGKVGEVNEDPFENKITDIPMTAMCNTIERDLKEMLGETELPPKLVPENGFIF